MGELALVELVMMLSRRYRNAMFARWEGGTKKTGHVRKDILHMQVKPVNIMIITDASQHEKSRLHVQM